MLQYWFKRGLVEITRAFHDAVIAYSAVRFGVILPNRIVGFSKTKNRTTTHGIILKNRIRTEPLRSNFT